MVPPVWTDESGNPRPVRAYRRCGRDASVYRFRLEYLRLMGWRPYASAEHVNWCWHGQEFILVPDGGGLVPYDSRAR